MIRGASPWHTVSITAWRAWNDNTRRWDLELERSIEEHPAACDRLPYGVTCWLDHDLGEFTEDHYPTESGYYAARIWSEGPDHNGEYDAGIDWELITPALPPPEHTAYTLRLAPRREIGVPTPVNGVRLWPNARRCQLDRPLGPTPWRRTAVTA